MVNLSKTWISQWSVKHIKVQSDILVMEHMVMFLSYNEVIPKQPKPILMCPLSWETWLATIRTLVRQLQGAA